MANQRGLIFLASHNFKQLVKPVYMITFSRQIKDVQQILRECDRVNRPLHKQCLLDQISIGGLR